ncbi:hypothetical protein [Streptomyces sp. NPDC088135]|uniref:hypothetical protein n=1 Tax=Streptomyces sp. NPDC088135 TaxID=3160993 RepID=UPI0034475045
MGADGRRETLTFDLDPGLTRGVLVTLPAAVNKARARAGESRTASRTSIEDMSSSRRGGLRSRSGAEGPTRDQLYEEARKKNVHGRSSMTKAELARAVGR